MKIRCHTTPATDSLTVNNERVYLEVGTYQVYATEGGGNGHWVHLDLKGAQQLALYLVQFLRNHPDVAPYAQEEVTR